ncbi:unnamed protein product, partial [Sphacelaria rigidula]
MPVRVSISQGPAPVQFCSTPTPAASSNDREEVFVHEAYCAQGARVCCKPTPAQAMRADPSASLPPGAASAPGLVPPISEIDDSSSSRSRRRSSGASGEVAPQTTVTCGAEVPLPNGWKSKRTKDGRVFYKNTVDKTTSWNRPTAPAVSTPSSSGSSEAPPQPSAPITTTAGGTAEVPLPEGWKRKTTKDGKVYYVNTVDKTTSWERPTAPATSAPSPSSIESGDVSWRSGESIEMRPQLSAPVTGNPGGTAESPLPEGWKRKTTKDGKVYYVNTVDKTTSWERPTAPATSFPSSSGSVEHGRRPSSSGGVKPQSSVPATGNPGSAAESPLPEGWKRKTTKDGKVYYVNTVDKTTSWERPTAPATSFPSPSGSVE